MHGIIACMNFRVSSMNSIIIHALSALVILVAFWSFINLISQFVNYMCLGGLHCICTFHPSSNKADWRVSNLRCVGDDFVLMFV